MDFVDIAKIIGIFGQFVGVLIHLYVVDQIRKKKKRRPFHYLSLFHLSQAFGYIILTIRFPFRLSMNQDLSFLLYNLSIFLLLLSFQFYFLFCYYLMNINKKKSMIIPIIYLCGYSLIFILTLILFPVNLIDGIPYFSWTLCIVIMILSLAEPHSLSLIVLYRMYHESTNVEVDENVLQLKRSMLSFQVGITIILIIHYGQALYNTWVENEIFRIIFPIFSLIALIPIYFIIYKFARVL